MAILAVILTAFAGALSTGLKILRVTDERQTAKNLAEHQMEYVMNEDYNPLGYTPDTVPAEYAGYVPSITATPMADNQTAPVVPLQKITVTINHEGNLFTLEDYKVRR